MSSSEIFTRSPPAALHAFLASLQVLSSSYTLTHVPELGLKVHPEGQVETNWGKRMAKQALVYALIYRNMEVGKRNLLGKRKPFLNCQMYLFKLEAMRFPVPFPKAAHFVDSCFDTSNLSTERFILNGSLPGSQSTRDDTYQNSSLENHQSSLKLSCTKKKPQSVLFTSF